MSSVTLQTTENLTTLLSSLKAMKISEINIYPIKSLGGISLNEAIIEQRGLQYDRRWMLVDENGKFLTQREFPKMSTISISLTKNGLNVAVAGFDDLLVPFEVEGERLKVQIWNSNCEAIISESQTNDWFSKVLQTNCRLVFMPDDSRREINPRFVLNKDIVSFADGYPFMILGENSLNDLNSRLETTLPMNRFRPNFVASNAEPFAEDFWKKIKIGETVFRTTKPCERCVITTVEQKDGVFTGKEPLKTLAKYRQTKQLFPSNYQDFGLSENAVLFGQNLVAENFGETIKVGDNIEILPS
jgi:uncharacterized protein